MQREVPIDEDTQPPIELRMPLDILWKGQEIIKEAEFMLSNNDDQVRIKDTYKRLLKLVTPYAVLEKDRTWLHEQTQ